MRLVAALELGADAITFPVQDDDYIVEFNADVLREIWVWGGVDPKSVAP